MFCSPPMLAARRTHEASGGWSGPEGGRRSDPNPSGPMPEKSGIGLGSRACADCASLSAVERREAQPLRRGGRASQGRPRKPALPACRTDPRKVRKGPRKPLAPPGAPFPFGERKKGQGVPRAFQRTGAAELDSRPPAVGSGNSLPSCPTSPAMTKGWMPGPRPP
jgi:hypothetical protein